MKLYIDTTVAPIETMAWEDVKSRLTKKKKTVGVATTHKGEVVAVIIGADGRVEQAHRGFSYVSTARAFLTQL